MFFTKNKYCIYTAIFGGKDELKEILHPENNVDYICFTDRDITSKTWDIVKTPIIFDNPRLSARFIKTSPHLFVRDYDYTFWIDAAFRFKKFHYKSLIDKLLAKQELATIIHPDRKCLYEEARVCIEQNLDDANIIRSQITRYEKEGFPTNNGLVASGFLLRKNKSQKVIEFNNMWWNEIRKGSIRDQISFNYIVWKLGLDFDCIDINYWDNVYAKWEGHLNYK